MLTGGKLAAWALKDSMKWVSADCYIYRPGLPGLE